MALDDRPQPPAESAAARYARDVSQRRGDWQNDANGDLVYVGPTAVGGRTNREITRRGGDHYYTYDVNGVATAHYDADGRNAREYVNEQTGVSAITGTEHEEFDALKANSQPDSV